jgi:hypothetical protein
MASREGRRALEVDTGGSNDDVGGRVAGRLERTCLSLSEGQPSPWKALPPSKFLSARSPPVREPYLAFSPEEFQERLCSRWVRAQRAESMGGRWMAKMGKYHITPWIILLSKQCVPQNPHA